MQLLLFLCLMFFFTHVGAGFWYCFLPLESVVTRPKQSEDHHVLNDGLPDKYKLYDNWKFDEDDVQHHTFYSEGSLPTSNDKPIIDRPAMSKRRRELERMACLLRFANRDKRFAQQQADARRFVAHGKTHKNSCIKNKAHHLNRPKPKV